MKDPVKEENEIIFDEQDGLIQNKTIRGCSAFSDSMFVCCVERDLHEIEWAGRGGLGFRIARNR